MCRVRRGSIRSVRRNNSGGRGRQVLKNTALEAWACESLCRSLDGAEEGLCWEVRSPDPLVRDWWEARESFCGMLVTARGRGRLH